MNKRMSAMLIAVFLGVMSLSACQTATPAPSVAAEVPAAKPTLAPGSVQLVAQGATFPLPVYDVWTKSYQFVDPAVNITYQGTGSGAGKKAIVDGTVDFAGSDSVLKDEYQKVPDLQMLPILAGAVVPIYNISFKTEAGAKVAKLILDRSTLVGIYNAAIKKWNDPAILALNPELKDLLPDANITAVHRSDGSGTTEVFTKSLAAFSPDWKAGAGSSVEWPVDKAGNGMGGKGNPGVAASFQTSPNSIGYVELSYAISNNIPFVKMVNKAGKTVEANAESLASAMLDFAEQFSDKLTNTIVDAPGEKSWPIAAYTYIILHTESMKDCAKAQKLLEYIRWTLTDASASKRAAELGYNVLPESVQKMVL